jgi:hypothetical protein
MPNNFHLMSRMVGISLGLILSACGGYASTAPPALTSSVTHATRTNSTHSWMKPVSSGQDLVYVADQATQNVDVFSYPQGQLVGTLTGLIHPTGECVDSSGNVFVISQENTSSYFASTIYEYAHGGTTAIATLTDPSRGEGCAVDSKSGNLAVSGAYFSSPYAYGAVAIFKGAQGDANMLYSKTLPSFWLCGYDPKGNLYVSADSGTSGEQQLIRLARGSNNFEQVTLKSPMYADATFPSSVQWDGKYMTVSAANANLGSGRYQPSYVYRLTISGSTATTVSTTTYTGKRKIMTGQVSIDGNHLIASHYHAGGGVDFWSYPNAGKAHTLVPTTSGVAPFGIVVSHGSR